MSRKIAFAFIAILIFSSLMYSGCAAAPKPVPAIWVTGISETLIRYYIPATTWQERANRSVSCRVDMTYINEPGRPVVCNISFYNKNVVPKEISDLFFTAEIGEYPLNNVNVMFTRPETGEQRITSLIDVDKLLQVFQSESISFKAVIDAAEYTFVPATEFLQYGRQFGEQVKIPAATEE